jgi:Fe-S cluster biosynthesis and repair protein YggX
MPRMIFCTYLQREAEGLDRVPYPGPLGQRIYENISRDAWQKWLGHQTTLMNEYRLSPIESKARKFLAEEMEKFLFGAGSEKPEGFVDPDATDH